MIMVRGSFLTWFLSLMIMSGAAYFAYEADFFYFVWDADVSKLCFVITLLFSLTYLRIGYLLYLVDFSDKIVNQDDLDIGYEVADMSMALGLLGTVIGFIVMSSSFTSIDFSNIENIKDLFKLATAGMSTALYTTAFGLVANITLRFVLFLFQKRIQTFPYRKD